MKYTPEQLVILQECKVVDTNGQLVLVDLAWPVEKPAGRGPRLDLDCIQQFLSADPSLRWTRWIFHTAAGGSRAQEASKRALAAVKVRFMEERVAGYFDPDLRKKFQPVTKEQAEQQWAAVEKEYAEELNWADQDCVDKAGAHGFYRSWPGGKTEIYAKVVASVQEFLGLEDRIKEMNEALSKSEHQAPVSLDPANYSTLEDLDKAIKLVARYFASKKAREDLRVVQVYASNRVEVTVPLSYAAAVRYGHPEWSWAAPAQFEQLLTAENSFSDPWKTAATKFVYVYVRITGVVPSWVSRDGEEFTRCYLTNLALQIPRRRKTLAGANVVNEAGESTWNLDDVRQLILAEPSRDDDPAKEEWPVKRGPKVYAKMEEAQAVVAELDKAVQAIEHWLHNFDASIITVDAMADARRA